MITLRTRDSSKVGNAIIYGGDQSEHTGQHLFLVETDFGNRMRLSLNELNELFILVQVRNYNEWRLDRSLLQEEVPIE